jgi:hypothetical protein
MASRGPSGQRSPDEFIERLKELVAADVAARTQLKARFSDFVREASQAVGTGRAGERTDAQALLSRWLDFNLESYSVVSAQGLALLNGLLSAAERTLIPQAPAPDTRATPAARVELRLSGRHGERATTGFVVENHFNRPLAVTFQSTDLVSKTGASLPASLVSFEPTTLVLEQRRQGVVQATVTITADFEVGQTYTATIRLLGFEAKEVGLSVTALPPADAAPSNPSPPPRKSTKKRQSRVDK